MSHVVARGVKNEACLVRKSHHGCLEMSYLGILQPCVCGANVITIHLSETAAVKNSHP